MLRTAGAVLTLVCSCFAASAAQDTTAHHPVIVNPHIAPHLQVAAAAKAFSREQISKYLGAGTRPVLIRREQSQQAEAVPAQGATLRVGDLVVSRVADRAVLTPRAGQVTPPA